MISNSTAATSCIRVFAIGLLLLSGLLPAPKARASTDVLDNVLHHHALIEGDGPRTVVLEAGFGDTLEVWQAIEPGIINCARTFAYNRAGYMGSDTASATRDSIEIVAELREELHRRHIAPPYVLVGHSLGGLYMQYFARNYPDEVAGLLLIDSTHWRQGMAIDSTANTPYQARRAVTLYLPLIMRRELTDSVEAGIEVNSSPKATNIPTIVLSATRRATNETEEHRAQEVALQDDIAADFPIHRHLFVTDSGHYIQRDKPEVVVAAIRDLAGCGS